MQTLDTTRPRIGRLGIWSLELRTLPRHELAEHVGALERDGWDAVWVAGANGPGLWRDAETMLTATTDLTVAFGVMSIWGQDAGGATSEHARLTSRHGRRLLVGLGVSNPQAAAATGRTYRSAIGSMTDYLDSLDGAPTPLAPADRVLGALGPRMTALAGARSAGAHPFLVTPGAHARSRALLGSRALLMPHQAVVLESSPERAREIARRGIGTYLRFPTYRRSLLDQGFSPEDLAGKGSDRLIDAVVAWGGVDAVGARVREHWDAGADHVALHVLTDDGEVPAAQWAQLAELLETRPE